MFGEGLLTGMGVTWKHFWGKKETFCYPEEKLPMTERFRGGHLVLDHKKCIACSRRATLPARLSANSGTPASIRCTSTNRAGQCGTTDRNSSGTYAKSSAKSSGARHRERPV